MQSTMNRLLIPLLVLSAGCVTQGTFDTLKTEHEATQSELAARNQKVREFEEKTAKLERDLKAKTARESELEESLKQEQARSAQLQERIAKVENDLATMVSDKSTLEASVKEMRQALAELQKRKEQADARIKEYRSLLSKFQNLIDAGKLTVKMQDGRMVVVLATDVLFGSGSASLSKDGKAAIAEIAQLLASIPKRSFQVEGHTDNVPINTAQYPSNWELASARALTVVKTMVDAGMPVDRISAASFGEAKPAAPNDTPEGRAANRRIEIIIVPDLSTLPGTDELQRVGGA